MLFLAKLPEEKNSGMYYVAKLFCNSLWGKYGQRDNFTYSETIYDRNRYCDIMFNDKYDSNFIFLTDKSVSVSYKQIEETLGAPTQTSIAIAAFTTAFARIRLHKAWNLLGDRVLYMDTDSIIFVDTLDKKTHKWSSKIEASFCLVDFTDELGNNTYITEFVSTGPK